MQCQILVKFTRRNIEAGIDCYLSASTPFFYLKYSLFQNIHTSLMTHQFFVAQTIRQTGAFCITRQSVYKHTSRQNVVSKENCLALYFCKKKMTGLGVGLLRIHQFFSVSSNTMYRWVKRDCRFMSNITRLNQQTQ